MKSGLKRMFRMTCCLLLVGVGFLLISGCVSQPVEKEYTPILMIAQNSDGAVTLSWESVVGYRYRLYLMDKGDTEWTPFGHAFDGTGELISLEGNSGRKNRRYWIQADPIAP